MSPAVAGCEKRGKPLSAYDCSLGIQSAKIVVADPFYEDSAMRSKDLVRNFA
jgi:hypothetical protein